jgi:hypothetical protein
VKCMICGKFHIFQKDVENFLSTLEGSSPWNDRNDQNDRSDQSDLNDRNDQNDRDDEGPRDDQNAKNYGMLAVRSPVFKSS